MRYWRRKHHSPEDDEFGKLLYQQVHVYEKYENMHSCPAQGIDPIRFNCGREKGHSGPHMAIGVGDVYELWYDGGEAAEGENTNDVS